MNQRACRLNLCQQGKEPCPAHRVCVWGDEEADQPLMTPHTLSPPMRWFLAALVVVLFTAAAVLPHWLLT